MYIGASFKCNQYCQQENRQKYDKSHVAHRHTIIDSESFKQQNDMFIRKSKRAWNSFSVRLQSFFKKLKNELNFMEKQAFNRLELQYIKSAIKTQDKHLTNISMDIFQARYRNLTCQDIDEFLQLRKKHQGPEPTHIKREQDQFALDMIDQINSFVFDISQELALKNDRIKSGNFVENRNKKKQKDSHQEKEQRDKYTVVKVKNQHYRQPRKKQQKPLKTGETQERRIPKKQEAEQYKRKLRERDDQKDTKKETKNNSKQQNPRYKEPYPLLKIQQLKLNSKAFDIDLKIVSFVKNIYGKEMWRTLDQTGQIMLVVPTHDAIKESRKIRIHNCYIKSYNEKLQIYAKESSKISYQNVKQQAFKFYQSNIKKPQELQNSNNKNSKQQRMLIKIKQLTPQSQRIKLIAKVISVEVVKQSEKKCVLGDETGTINAKFNGYDQLVKVGKILYFRGLQVEVDDCGHMFVTGSKVLIELAHDEIKSIRLNNNLSSCVYSLAE